jgi:hypothetical protein
MDAYDFDIYKGSTFSLGLTLKDGDGVPMDLSSYNVSGFLRYSYSDSSRLADLNATKVAPYASGGINLTIPSSGTAVLPVTICVYDVEIYHTGAGTVDKVLKGAVSVYPEATY